METIFEFKMFLLYLLQKNFNFINLFMFLLLTYFIFTYHECSADNVEFLRFYLFGNSLYINFPLTETRPYCGIPTQVFGLLN